MNKPTIIKACAATCLTTLLTTAHSAPIFHSLTITPGDQPAVPGPISGSYFSMGGISVVLQPGSAGALNLGTDQNFVLNPDEPHPVGHPDAASGAGSGYPTNALVTEGTVLQPFKYFGVSTYVGTNPLSYQSGDTKTSPSADVDMGSCVANVCTITADLSSWEVFWNGSAFEQGPRPVNTGPFTMATGTYNLNTHGYILDWVSQINGGPFNGVPAAWHLEGTHGVFVVSSDDGSVSPSLAAAVVTTESELTTAGKATDPYAAATCNPVCLDIIAPANAGMSTVIAPLPAPLVADTVIRINVNDTWQDFDTAAGNSISTAAGSPGFCPPPGSAQYTDVITAGDLCVQLKISDSGTNDEDSVADQVTGIISFSQGVVIPVVVVPPPPPVVDPVPVVDPAPVTDPAPVEDPAPTTSAAAPATDSGSMDTWLMILSLMSFGLLRIKRNR